MDAKQFHARLLAALLILAAILTVFGMTLYDLQIVHGEDYRKQSVRKITNTETVEAARGQILDRYGRVLVSNRTTYQVKLNTRFMGEEAQRNAILLTLLEICREENVAWVDTLPVSPSAPFTYRMDTLTDTGKARYESMLEGMSKFGWPAAAEQGAGQLIAAMRTFFEVDPELSDEAARALVGVLYELRIRSMDIVRTEYIFAQDVDITFISRVKEEDLTGVTIGPTTVRQYETAAAPHLLGRVALIDSEDWPDYKARGYNMNDTVGRDGVELAFEEHLRGEAGVRDIETNTSGKTVSESWRLDPDTGEPMEPKPGDNVSLTLDIRLQEAAERALADGIAAMKDSKAAAGLPDEIEGGALVVTDMTGGVLAMCSYPDFDLATIYADAAAYNAAAADPLKPFVNRAAQGTYSPGSTFKMVVGTAALQEGVVTPSETILDTGRFTLPEEKKYPYGDYHPQCWALRQYGYTHGRENMADAIRDSCNIYFYTVGHRLGIDLIDRYAAMFGLGEYTGFELPEYKGLVAGPETSGALGVTWYGGDLLSAAIGQGNTLSTPLQLSNYIATLVNGGNHYAAHLLQSVKSNDFSTVLQQEELQLLDTVNISQENLEAVKLGMWKVANEKDGSVYKYFRDLPVEVGGKTGTAQVSANTEANAVFVCFAPYDNPEIAMTIVVEHGGSGTELGGIAADLLSYYFNTERNMEAVDGENTLLR